MHFIYNNLAAIHVAVVTSLVAWIFGGTRGDLLLPVMPWIFLFTAEILFVFPQKQPGEAMSDARDRVWRALKKDPFFWVSLLLLAVLAIPFGNNGLCVNCDCALIAQGHSPEPPVRFLPSCVNRLEHFNVFLWFATALSVAVVARHCLRRPGKRLALEMIVWNGFALAVLGFVQSVAGAPGPLWQPLRAMYSAGVFFSTFGYPNMAGDYFTTLFGLAIALWRRSDDEMYDLYRTNRGEYEKNRYRTFCRRHYHLIPAAVFFFAALNTLSRAALILIVSLTAIYFVHAFLAFSRRMHRAERVRKGAIALAVTGAAVFFAIQSLPEDLQREADSIGTREVLARVTGKGEGHVHYATKIWKEHFLFGCGGWGYRHFVGPVMRAEGARPAFGPGGANVHNDYMQFLAEHGFVGFGLIALTVLMLLSPVFRAWKHLYRMTRFEKAADLPAKPVALFSLPAPVFCILMALFATLVHAFGDCPLRSCAVLVLFYVSLASLPGFLPKDMDLTDQESRHASR